MLRGEGSMSRRSRSIAPRQPVAPPPPPPRLDKFGGCNRILQAANQRPPCAEALRGGGACAWRGERQQPREEGSGGNSRGLMMRDGRTSQKPHRRA
eukprot:scaffold128065_cov48-Phaeocystis_antarctica.AAC.2